MARSHVLVPSAGTIKLATNQYTDGGNVKDDEVVAQGEEFLPSYTQTVDVSTATLNSHLLQIMAGASLRVRIRRLEVHQLVLATAAAFMGLGIYRLTTAGTGGGVPVFNPLDPADAASGATIMTLPTGKGTEAQVIWGGNPYMMQTMGASAQLNQPIALIDFDRRRSKPLVIQAGTTSGIALKNLTAIAGGSVRISFWIDESPY